MRLKGGPAFTARGEVSTAFSCSTNTSDSVPVPVPVSTDAGGVTGTGTGTESLVFVEQENAVLTSPLAVNAGPPFSLIGYGDNGTLDPLNPGTIPAGTDVTSVYLHSFFAPNTSGHVYTGSITFSTPILGV